MLLSVLVPSNRNLAASRRSIETALAFCKAQDAALIVSDNSRDPDKRLWLDGLSPRLHYIQPPDDLPETNILSVLSAAKTEFVLMMGDDDELFVSPKDRPLDLATLDDTFIGVRPLVAVANSLGKVIRVKDFGIMDATPGARVMTYNANAKGDNAAYYSIYRRKPFTELVTFFIAHHPLKARFSDWALACVMFSYGKLAYDPGTIFKYNYHQWDGAAKIEGQKQVSYAEVGLPEHTDRFALLLLYLDTMILALRQGSHLDETGKRDIMVHAGVPILAGFCRAVAIKPEDYDEKTRHLADSAFREPDVGSKFSIALGMADGIMPGLTERYQNYWRIASGT